MAIGDTSQIKLLHKSLTTSATDSQYTNIGANTKTTITSITAKLQNGATAKRAVTIYLYGTAVGDETIGFDLDPNGIKNQVLTQLDYVLSNTDTVSCKVDAGADVNITIMGLTEVVSNGTI